MRFLAGPGQEHDLKRADDLIDGIEAEHVIADRAYDANGFVSAIETAKAIAVIPAKRNRKQPRDHDATLYHERNQIERMFNRLKQFRRVATRYDKLLVNYLGFVKLAAIALWLR